MDIYNFIGKIFSPSKLHEHIETALTSWPLAFLIIGITFRKQLITIISKIRSLNYKDGSREIALKWEENIKELIKIKQIAESEEILPRENSIDEISKIIELAKINPRSAILESWLHLEEETRNLISDYEEKAKPHLGAWATERDLWKLNLITPSERELFYKLRTLRNEAIHMKSFEISEEGAITYIDNAISLANKFKRIREENRPKT
ncbi:hypothetical protein [Oceanibaculum nanhaiense]|uniref:hypothetical protein n=1 Tax=Oceanibaculum nanhaiense TaxID=1909734 RepID=UPI003F6E9B44